MGWKQDLKKASRDGLTNKEVKQIAKQYGGVSKSDVRKRAENRGFFDTASPGTTTTKKEVDDFPAASNNFNLADYTALYETMQTGQANLAHIQGDYSLQAAQAAANAQVSAAGIRGDADKEVAKAYSDAQKYGYDRGLEGTKYSADKESEWRQNVANIEVGGKKDLQGIINAGLKDVANIEAQAQRDVAETTGGYSLKSMQERTKADRDIASMGLAGSMYGLIGSVFG
jgi:hypothetical protein